MITLISSFITVFRNIDKIEQDGLDFHDSTYPYQVIGISFIIECVLSVILLVKWIIKKLIKK